MGVRLIGAPAMGRSKKASGGADVQEMKRQMEALRMRQEQAMQAVQQAQQELLSKQEQIESSRRELQETEAARDRAGREADFCAKTLSGDDVAAKLADGLQRDGYAVVDGFLGEPVASYIRDEMRIMQRDGLLKESELAGGKTGTNMRYSMASVRGDVVRFVDGTEAEGCYNIGLLKEFSDQVVIRVQERVPGLQAQVIQRGKLMCTCYPGDALDDKPCGQGGPCRYVRHCDNPDKNGRVLTALYYLNSHWVPSHGGCLRIYPSDAAGQSLSAPVDIEPVLDRFLLFYSDKRCPHEVLAARAPRYAITTWYYNAEERRHAVAMAEDEQNIETTRILQEIEKFKTQTGSDVSKVSEPAPREHTAAGAGAPGPEIVVPQVTDTSIPGVLPAHVLTQGGFVDLEQLD